MENLGLKIAVAGLGTSLVTVASILAVKNFELKKLSSITTTLIECNKLQEEALDHLLENCDCETEIPDRLIVNLEALKIMSRNKML